MAFNRKGIRSMGSLLRGSGCKRRLKRVHDNVRCEGNEQSLVTDAKSNQPDPRQTDLLGDKEDRLTDKACGDSP